jgi:Domain of unknown function (DUF1330)
LEGERTPRTIVIFEFPSMERARQWYQSPEYAEALEIGSVRFFVCGSRCALLFSSGQVVLRTSARAGETALQAVGPAPGEL